MKTLYLVLTIFPFIAEILTALNPKKCMLRFSNSKIEGTNYSSYMIAMYFIWIVFTLFLGYWPIVAAVLILSTLGSFMYAKYRKTIYVTISSAIILGLYVAHFFNLINYHFIVK